MYILPRKLPGTGESHASISLGSFTTFLFLTALQPARLASFKISSTVYVASAAITM
jgi:hypothetical protein